MSGATAVKKQTMNVPLLDLKAQFVTIEDEVRAAMDSVFETQRFILGPQVSELEKEIAAYSQCEHAVGVSSGTDALLLALMALGVGRGDEVITTPYSFFATAGVVSRLGARPVFCDIDPLTYNLALETVKTFISERCESRGGKLINRATQGEVKVLMPVHLFGQTAEMPALCDLAAAHGLRVVEDAAQAIGSEYAGGKRAGSMGDIGCFSFFPSKNLGAFGDGGMCTTNDAALAERMRILRVHGSKPKYYHALVGGNFRLDELQAAVLRVKLRYLDQWTEARQRNAAHYTQALADAGLGEAVQTPHRCEGYRHIYNQYVIRVSQRDALQASLKEASIGTEVYYPVSLHAQECFADLGYAKGDFPHSSSAAAQTLALPVYPELTEAQLDYVVDAVAGFHR